MPDVQKNTWPEQHEASEESVIALGGQPSIIQTPLPKQSQLPTSPERTFGEGRRLLGMGYEHIVGKSEKELNSELNKAYDGKENVDIGRGEEGEPWCADFINYALKKSGLPTSGARSVVSFKNYGTPVKSFSEAKPGDIILSENTDGSGARHSAFYLGPAEPMNGKQRVRVLTGNWTGKVQETTMYIDGREWGKKYSLRRPPYQMRWER